MTNPKQSQTLHIEPLGDELSIYDWQRLQMHSLNPTAARVFELCDGQTSPTQMAKRLDAPEAVVWQSLEELGKASLLQTPIVIPRGVTRQQFLKVGGAIALASIVSIVVPRPAAAQTPAAAAAAGGPITRTITGLTATASGTYYYYAFDGGASITDADLAFGPTSITYSWTGAVTSGVVYLYLAQTNTIRANSFTLITPPGTASPVTATDANDWTGNRPYNGLQIDVSGSTDWSAGTLTITLA